MITKHPHHHRLARRALAAGVLSVLAVVVSRGAYLETDTSEPARPPVIRPGPQPEPWPQPPPWPRPPPREHPAQRLLADARVGEPYRYRDMLVYPLTLARVGDGSAVRTLEEAQREGWLDIRESGTERVAEVSVINRGGQPVMIMAGELLAGGKQDRAARVETLLPPHSDVITLPVYCVEQHRWSEARKDFAPPGIIVHPALRKSVAAGASQDAVWREVAESTERMRAPSETGAYQAIHDNARVQHELGDVAASFRRMMPRATCGVAVVAGARVLGADLFGDPALFERECDKVLRSYAIGYLATDDEAPVVRGMRRPPPWDGAADVRRLLERASAARIRPVDSPGIGQVFGLQGGVDGMGIVWQGDVLHVAVWP